MDIHWYKSFFHGITLDFWDKVMTPEQTRLEADFLEKALLLQPGSRVLDVPCGLGRLSLNLAARGYQLTGADISEEALAIARKRATEQQAQVEWIRSDMAELNYESQFDAAFCFGNSFGYLEAKATATFIRALSRALKPGGRFAMDSGLVAETLLPKFEQRQWFEIDDILFLEENRYHPLESCLETLYSFVRDGKMETRSGLHWIYTVREIRSLLLEAGLRPLSTFKSLNEEDFELGSTYLYLVAQKE